MNFAAIELACRRAGLSVVGGLCPRAGDGAPVDCATLLLLGPGEPGFWARIKSSPEFSHENPVDDWSVRVVSALADELGARALFPFGGPPHQPFVRWALGCGRVWQSPVGLLVHDVAGLMLSFRGALAFSHKLALPEHPANPPCATCAERPCLSACPVAALTPDGYAVAKCHAYLETPKGHDCLSGGCQVRTACPVSRSYGRLAEQSAHHMKYFHKKADP